MNGQLLLLPAVGTDLSPPLLQVACHNQAITAIVARTNQYQYLMNFKPALYMLLTHIFHEDFSGAFPRVFHQYVRGEAIFTLGSRFQIAHFVNGHNMHYLFSRML